MDFPTMKINKNKRIGRVLFIVEGEKTESYILCRIFEKIYGYHYTRIYRNCRNSYDKLSSNEDKNSRVFVINAEESNIVHIADKNQYLDTIFIKLIEDYDLDFENMAIYYIWDRDYCSNTDIHLIKQLLNDLANSRDSASYDRQGLLLLSYPSVEAYTIANFNDNCFNNSFATGRELRQFLHKEKINHHDITDETIVKASIQLLEALQEIKIRPDFDNMSEFNVSIFEYQENNLLKNKTYRLLSLLSIALFDLGLISE